MIGRGKGRDLRMHRNESNMNDVINCSSKRWCADETGDTLAPKPAAR